MYKIDVKLFWKNFSTRIKTNKQTTQKKTFSGKDNSLI